MVGKKSGKALLREEGLERTDNNMDLTSWPQVIAINQKNYYTDYLKRDEQILAFRSQQEDARNRMVKQAKDRDRALAQGQVIGPDGDIEMDDDQEEEEEEEASSGSKTIVLHIGSQNLRVGLANDALPRTVPMVIARRAAKNESEEGDGEPRPKRVKLDNGLVPQEPEKRFGDEFYTKFGAMSNELKVRMRLNKRKVLPQSRDMVVSYNRRTTYDTITEHNDTLHIDWTEVVDQTKGAAPEYITGKAALRIPDKSNPRYKLYWPIQHGWVNEKEYSSRRFLYEDIRIIIEDAIQSQIGVEFSSRKEWQQYSCVIVIPDYYERTYVTSLLDMAISEFGFGKVCFIQESLAASFGAGFTTCCIVDIGAQKTSISCVEDGMVVDNSRINLKYGGEDVTETFVRMIIHNHFPYADINLKRRYDFQVAEELKQKFCTMTEADIQVQLYDFYLRAPNQSTRKYSFKVHDEVILAPMGFFKPDIFTNQGKLAGRRKLIDKSYDIYDGKPNDPTSTAQAEILTAIAPEDVVTSTKPQTNGHANGHREDFSMDSRRPSISRVQDMADTPGRSAASSPVRQLDGTPQPDEGDNQTAHEDKPKIEEEDEPLSIERRDDILPVYPLANAIVTSITHAARGSPQKTRDLLGGIMLIGGSSAVPGLSQHLEVILQGILPGHGRNRLDVETDDLCSRHRSAVRDVFHTYRRLSTAVAAAISYEDEPDDVQQHTFPAAQPIPLKALPMNRENPAENSLTDNLMSIAHNSRKRWRVSHMDDIQTPYGYTLSTIPIVTLRRVGSESGTLPEEHGDGYILKVGNLGHDASVERYIPDHSVFPPIFDEVTQAYGSAIRSELQIGQEASYMDDLRKLMIDFCLFSTGLKRKELFTVQTAFYDTNLRWSGSSPFTVRLSTAWLQMAETPLTQPYFALTDSAAIRGAFLTAPSFLQRRNAQDVADPIRLRIESLQKLWLSYVKSRTYKTASSHVRETGQHEDIKIEHLNQNQAASSSPPFTITLAPDETTLMLRTLQVVRKHGLPDHFLAPRAEMDVMSVRPPRQASLTALNAISTSRNAAYDKKLQHSEFRHKLERRSKLPMMQMQTVTSLLDTVTEHDVTIIVASTGSGKTTQVPQILLDDAIVKGVGATCNVLCTQPRRISATSIARRVAFERSEVLGQSVGSQVRFSSRPPQELGSITYCTTGFFLSRLYQLSDQTMAQYSHIIVDEVHERDIPIDLTLALLRSLVSARRAAGKPHPKIILMSATIDTSALKAYFGQVATRESALKIGTFDVEGGAFPVHTTFLPEIVSKLEKLHGSRTEPDSPLHHGHLDSDSVRYLAVEARVSGQNKTKQVKSTPVETIGASDNAEEEKIGGVPEIANAENIIPIGLIGLVVANIARNTDSGDILVFLPGFQELERLTIYLLERRRLDVDFGNPTKFKLFKLHSALHEANDAVFEPIARGCRRIILATNIAETSITLPEVVYVVDSGRVRQMVYDQIADTSELGCRWISTSNSIQRRGRAGRVRPGFYYAMFSKDRSETFQETPSPEILRSDLMAACLDVKSYSSSVHIAEFMKTLIDPPSQGAVEAAIRSLKSIGALTSTEDITPLGRIITSLPLHPYQGRLVLLGILFRCLTPALIMACHDRENQLVADALERGKVTESRNEYSGNAQSDLYYVVSAFQEYRSALKSQDRAFVEDLKEYRFIRPGVHAGMVLVINQVIEILSHSGILPPTPNGSDSLDAIPNELNVNSHQIPLIKALALGSINRRLACWDATGPKRRWLTQDNAKALMDSRSVNEPQKTGEASFLRHHRPHGELLAFTAAKKMQGDKFKWLMETTCIPNLMACLFGSDLQPLTTNVDGAPVVQLDGWLQLQLKDDDALQSQGLKSGQAGRILIEFRKATDRFIVLAFSDLQSSKRAITQQEPPSSGGGFPRNSWLGVESHDCRDAMINGIIRVLNADAARHEVKYREFMETARDAMQQARKQRQEEAEQKSKEKFERLKQLQAQQRSELQSQAVPSVSIEEPKELDASSASSAW